MEPVSNHFQNNMHLLEIHHSNIWEQIRNHTGNLRAEIRMAKDGNPNLLIRGKNGEEFLLHDDNAPQSELDQYFNLVSEDSNGVVLYIGMGLGYTPLGMLQKRKKVRHFVIFEPEPDIFIQALTVMDLSALLTDKRVLFAIGSGLDVSQALAPIGRALALENLHILNHLPSVAVNPEAYRNLHDECYKLGNTINVSGMTTRTFGRKFVENRLTHMSAIHHQRLLEHLKDAFTGKPALIVASGPSLNKNIHLLPQAKGKAVMIGVDTVLPALLKNGIMPDFTTAIDMQDIVIEKMVDVSTATNGTSLVCASWVSPTIPKNIAFRQIYWTFAAKHMEMWLNDLLGGKILTSGAGTVAHLSFTTAVMLGCSPIIFVGQDLAYTDRLDHAQHTSLSQKDDLASLYAQNAIQWVEGYGGISVPTTRGWLSDKHHFERTMAALPDIKFINATEGGVRLEGTEELSLQEALSRYCKSEFDIEEIVRRTEQEVRMTDRSRMAEEFKRQLKSIGGMEKDISRMENLCAKNTASIRSLRKQGRAYTHFDMLPLPLKQRITESDAVNKRMDKAHIWKLLDEVTMEGLFQSERLNHEINQLEGKPERYLEWLEKNIERFVFISQCRREVLAPVKQQLKHLSFRLKRESVLLEKNGSSPALNPNDFLELLRLYYEDSDHILLAKTIADLCPDNSESAEISFYLGAIAAHQSQFNRAENHWSRATALDSTWSDRIAQCRRKLGDQYLGFSREWERNDRDVSRRMLFKGLRHCPDHPEIGTILAKQADDLLTKVQSNADKDAAAELTEKFKPWCAQMNVDPKLGMTIGPRKAAALYRHYGRTLTAAEEYRLAAEAFAAAVALTPDDPDLYLSLADAAFFLDDLDRGVEYLDKAVTLDRRYAEFWEKMGDNLACSARPRDAVAAYERCLLSMPERIVLLKKIGDCHMALDQPEAALEAYKYYKVKLKAAAPVDETETCGSRCA